MAKYKFNNLDELGQLRHTAESPSVDKHMLEAEKSVVSQRVYKRVSEETSFVERVVGFVPYEWDYSIEKYHGKSTKPQKFTIFDEILCKILLLKDSSLNEIGTILCLDMNDEAEKGILSSAIDELKTDKMLDGDDSYYYLTEVGKVYAEKGEKFTTFERDFELYFDNTTGFAGNCKNVFKNLETEKLPDVKIYDPQRGIEDIKKYAVCQASEVHFPESGCILQECSYLERENHKAHVWVALLENFQDKTVRALVYDEKKDVIVRELSEALNEKEELKLSVLEKIVGQDNGEVDSVSDTTEEKSPLQAEEETRLVSLQEEYNIALKNNDSVKTKEIEKRGKTMKRLFDSLEFEEELERLFQETKCDLWLISPWIKRRSMDRRLPLIKKYLQKGGRVFMAYSQPENGIDEMVDTKILQKLSDCESQYQNFYICQMKPFHSKFVWVRGSSDGDCYYSGSFNVLSFCVNQNDKRIRQEVMTKTEWDSEAEKKYYKTYVLDFFDHYYTQLQEKIERLNAKKFSAKELKYIKIEKLTPFLIDESCKEKYKFLQHQLDDMNLSATEKVKQ